MSVSDPLIKELKGHLRTLIEKHFGSDGTKKTPVTDESEELVKFCESLEKVLSKGLKPQLSPLGFGREGDVWTWMSFFGDQRKGATFGYEYAVSSVKKDSKVSSNIGRMRLLIRTCLSHHCLFKPIEMIVSNQQLASRWYHSTNSIVAHEILGEILLSVMHQVGQLVFHLDITNSFFLDESWLIPPRQKFEFVPSKELGICVIFVRGKGVIVGLREYGVAAENESISIGDVLEELNGEVVLGTMKGRLSTALRRNIGQPSTLSIIKANHPDSGKPYPPLQFLKRLANADPSELERLQFSTTTNSDKKSPYLKPANDSFMVTKGTGYPVMYAGSVPVGAKGDFSLVETAVETIFKAEERSPLQPVLLECQEMNVRVVNQSSGKTLMRHTFMQISSCGSSYEREGYFGYIAGDESCNIAKEFTCHVFYWKDDERVNVILNSIAQGFQRTHYVV
ncbi:uncharacterized protein LOC117649660 isoform X1 [Thrips palmi]|uniref:Uncharacterized protein LOC117649660 isoform X1 n=2 Tax=Thrips palmi TaxID=161013 RepID=A0A6P8ZT92_THRPL|nr:uncharacterized protein LOC117649660 isoform X1 [Thrips palmi]